MSIINYDNKYIELLIPIIIHSKTDRRFLRRIMNQVLKDPQRKAYIRRSIAKPNKFTVYVNVPRDYDSFGYKDLYDESEIVRV